ncbi:unnamed protein product [Enterobius vermicularis]|uniref:Protein SNA4 n=1 Tax=Enterobius vermicularis TaxID=51028 RepID=A0A158QAE0_ENTVE|nr:unnamed protein product [Enterobius vermicularis]
MVSELEGLPADLSEARVEVGRISLFLFAKHEKYLFTLFALDQLGDPVPAAVALQANECNINVLINLGLFFFFVVPACIHAIWYCFFRKDPLHTLS